MTLANQNCVPVGLLSVFCGIALIAVIYIHSHPIRNQIFRFRLSTIMRALLLTYLSLLSVFAQLSLGTESCGGGVCHSFKTYSFPYAR